MPAQQLYKTCMIQVVDYNGETYRLLIYERRGAGMQSIYTERFDRFYKKKHYSMNDLFTAGRQIIDGMVITMKLPTIMDWFND
jgi:hypothetical protein